MQKIILDDEFKFLLPALDAETYRLLEENTLQYGVRDPNPPTYFQYSR